MECITTDDVAAEALLPEKNPASERRPSGARRRGRHQNGSRVRGRRRGFSGELTEWAWALDGVLSLVEELAWSARDVADRVREAWHASEENLRDAQDGLRDRSNEWNRLRETAWMLTRTAASYRFYGFRAAFVSRRRAGEILEELHGQNARRFYEMSVLQGGAFLKVGQLLSARPDLLPAVWIRELEKLQDAAPPFPFSDVREAVERDLGRPIEAAFRSFDEEPIAAASIGQVHRAVTTDGVTVAVKVRRPGIAHHVKMDLDLLQAFFGYFEDSLPEVDYETILREVRRIVLAELDYRSEANAARAISEFFLPHPRIDAPAPVASLCGDRVLTTEFVEGEKITAVLDRLDLRVKAGDAGAKAEVSTILGTLLEAYLRQVLEAGIFQADPHPGNLLVTRDGKVVVLDFGSVEKVPREVRNRYLALLCAFVGGDREKMAELFEKLGFRTRSGRPETLHAFAEAFLSEIRSARSTTGVRWPTPRELSERTRKLFHASESDPVVRIPPEFVMIARVFATLGGLFARYEPDIDFDRCVLPVLVLAVFNDEGDEVCHP